MKLPAVSLSTVLSLSPGLLALCLACSPAVSSPKPKSTPKAESSSLLEEGKPVERVLHGGETQEHRLAVQAGWYVRMEIEQIGIDVAASLLGPDGTTLFSTDDPDGLQDKEILELIAPADEELRLVVAPHDSKAAPGAYRVALIARRFAGPGDSDRAAAREALTRAWRLEASQDETGRKEAVASYQKAVRLWEGAREIGAEIEALNELGVLQSKLSDLQAALASFQRALSLSSAIGDLTGEAFARSNLAGIPTAPQRIENYERALALFRQLRNHREEGRVLYGIGLIYRDRVELDQALRYLSEALPVRRAAGDKRGELRTLVALAGVHLNQGEIEQASASLGQALELSRSVGWDGEASILSTMAQIHRYRGELGDSLARLEQARDIYHRIGDEGYEARILHHLGALYLDLGDLDEAQRTYEQGRALVAGKDPEGEAHFLNSLGWTLYLRGRSQEALGYFTEALSLAREKNLPAGISQALQHTGAVYVDLGRAQEGLKLLQEDLSLCRKNGDRSEEATSLLEIGRAWQALGHLDQSADSFHDALELGRRLGNMGLQATCLYRWALLDRQRGDLRQALGRVEEALAIIESVRSRVSSQKLRITFLASKRAWYELYIDLLMRLDEAEPGHGHAAAALEASERARARGLLDLIAEGRIDVQEGIAPELKHRERELGARLSWIQERLGEPADPNSGGSHAAELLAQLDQTGEEMERLEEEIRRRHPRYAEVRYPTPLRLEQIENLLDERTALLEYFVGRESSYLFVVTRTRLSVHRLPGANVLEKKVEEVRKTLQRPGILTLGRFRRAAGELYDVLLGPAGARLASMPNFLISPDGPLFLVPFEALLTDPARGFSYKDLAYLLRSHAISYIPSASVLDGLREPRKTFPPNAVPPKQLIAFADPVYSSEQVAASTPIRNAADARSAPPLPGSGREVSAIANLYPRAAVEVYTGQSATEKNIKENPLIQTARLIHFATHGFVDEARPQLSGLMLTPDPGSGEDGLLQVYEIFNLRLNADLVTLSACETGLGEQVTGEGMVGLTRAFIYAGTRSLVVSLWPVSDLSTPELMTSFYRHLADGGTKAEALGRAKLERMAAGDEPYRWAPFILAGDPH